MACVLCTPSIMVALAIAVTVLWKKSATFKYYCKWLIFLIGSTISATFPIPIMLLKPRDSKNALWPAAGSRCISQYFLGVERKVEGHENIVEDSGCVIIINHQSMLDLVVLAELWPIMDNCAVISKKEIFYLQPFGLASWLWGTIFIDRVKKEKAQEAVNETARTINARKARVLMFPEGTRNTKDKLLPFKKGAFHLAVAAGCPIQPVVVSRYTFLGKCRFDEGNMKIKILPAISTKGYTKDDIQVLVDKCYEVMSENVDLVTKENSITNPVANGTQKTKVN